MHITCEAAQFKAASVRGQIITHYFPVEEKARQELVPKRKQILCVCQDELTLQVRQMLLEHFGYEVLTTDSVGKMHAILHEVCPDMLLLDTSDPELDWQQVSDKAKSICPDILSVVLTADYGRLNDGDESVDRFLRLDGPREEWVSGIESLFDRQSRTSNTTI